MGGLQIGYAFWILPALIDLTDTKMRLVAPLGRRTLTFCRFGLNQRVVLAVTCVPMPPLFLDCPLR